MEDDKMLMGAWLTILTDSIVSTAQNLSISIKIDNLVQEEKQLAISNIGSGCSHLLMNLTNYTTNY